MQNVPELKSESETSSNINHIFHYLEFKWINESVANDITLKEFNKLLFDRVLGRWKTHVEKYINTLENVHSAHFNPLHVRTTWGKYGIFLSYMVKNINVTHNITISADGDVDVNTAFTLFKHIDSNYGKTGVIDFGTIDSSHAACIAGYYIAPLINTVKEDVRLYVALTNIIERRAPNGEQTILEIIESEDETLAQALKDWSEK